MKIRWAPRGLRTRDAQLRYISERNPAAVIRLGEAIRSAIATLADHPHMGRAGRVNGTRELVESRTPYVVVYRIRGQEVCIVRVLHSAQCWPAAH
ncbi:MAG TPA: type II toxin-antitoxin system RelE/ParE family toxin [Acetobacteraceae bacterium]|nr:type II toxin-antitoxin system RelE/ParE family toxin [Acetobacteraceae bacterium]